MLEGAILRQNCMLEGANTYFLFYTPKTIAGSMFSFRLISLPTFIVGSHLPER